jgi:hypothetical protein
MIERIDVRYEPALRQHELMIHFIRPLVGDSINKYVNGNKKKYTIQNGTKDILVQVKKNLRLHAAKLDIKSGEIDITNCKHEVIDPTSKLQRDGGVVTQVHNPIVLRI